MEVVKKGIFATRNLAATLQVKPRQESQRLNDMEMYSDKACVFRVNTIGAEETQ